MENYKYDVVDTNKSDNKIETQDTNFPQYLLGDSLKEAERVLAEFNTYINNVASAYAASSNIDKSEFFGDAIIALGKAKRDYTPDRGSVFIPYAKFIIVDSMNECVRKNKATVRIPIYINKAHKIILRIKVLIAGYAETIDDILFDTNFNWDKIPEVIRTKIIDDKILLERSSERAKITLKVLIDRAEYLPLMISTDIAVRELSSNNLDEEHILAKLIVNEIKSLLNSDELDVANLIMEGKRKVEICELLDRSNTWTSKRIENIRNKAKLMVLNKGK